jgi:hypothetical protein
MCRFPRSSGRDPRPAPENLEDASLAVDSSLFFSIVFSTERENSGSRFPCCLKNSVNHALSRKKHIQKLISRPHHSIAIDPPTQVLFCILWETKDRPQHPLANPRFGQCTKTRTLSVNYLPVKSNTPTTTSQHE